MITTGTMSGESSSGMISLRPGSLSLASAIEVSVPSAVASSVAPKATSRLLPIAARHRSEPSTTSYQRVDSPASGKVKKEPLLKDSGTGTKIGTMRNTTVRPHQSHRSPKRIRSPVVGYGDSSMAHISFRRSRPRRRANTP